MSTKFPTDWSFDWKTSLITFLFFPVALSVGLLCRKYLKSWVNYITEAVMYALGRSINTRIAARASLRRFCRLQLGGDTRYLHVPSSMDIKLDIDKAFIKLSLEQQTGDPGYDHTTLTSLGNRIRVIGDPGSGKSSLVKQLMRDCCRSGLRAAAKSKLPLLLELKRLDVPKKKDGNELGTWLFQKLRADACKSNVYKMGECFDAFCSDNGLLVLLDGLDEVSSSDYPKVQRAIDGLSDILARKGERNVIVLTMRTQFHQLIREVFRESFGRALFLRPFTPTDIYEFLTRWPFPDKGKHVTRIFGELTDRPSLREMCTNPLVLSMYVAEDQAKGHVTAPDSRTEFYRKVTDELLIKRRMKQVGPTPASGKLREQRERILGTLAFNHMLNPDQPGNSLSWSAAIEAVSQIMKCDAEQAAQVFQEIAKETGLVTEERPNESFCFIHLTFCEFLAAFEAIHGQHGGWDALLEAHSRMSVEPQLRSRLAEVIPFAAGLVQRVYRDNAVSNVAALGDRGLLARTLLETKLYDHRSWPVLAENWKNELLSVSEDAWGADWLRDLHLFNVVIRDANLCTSHMGNAGHEIDLEQFFRALLDRQRTSLSKVLGAYAAQDAAAAFRLAEVCHLDLLVDVPEIVLRNLDQPPFFALVTTQALGEPERVGLWAPLLSEASLRSQVVADLMSELDKAKEWSEFELEIPSAARWSNSTLLPKNFCSQSLTIALGPRANHAGYQEYLSLVAKLPSPGQHRILYLAVAAFLPLILSACLLATNANLSVSTIDSGRDLWMRFATIGVATILVSISYVFLLREMALIRAYERVLGWVRLIPDSAGVPLAKARSLTDLILRSTFSNALIGRRFRETASAIHELRSRSGDVV